MMERSRHIYTASRARMCVCPCVGTYMSPPFILFSLMGWRSGDHKLWMGGIKMMQCRVSGGIVMNCILGIVILGCDFKIFFKCLAFCNLFPLGWCGEMPYSVSLIWKSSINTSQTCWKMDRAGLRVYLYA